MKAVFLNSVVLSSALMLLSTTALGQSQQQPSQNASRTGTVSRGMIVPTTEIIPNGVRIIVDTYSMNVNDQINLEVQIALKKSAQDTSSNYPIKLADLINASSEKVFQNGKQLKFDLSFDQLNDALKAAVPNAPHLKVGPGTPLLVYANWANGHQWGGAERGGLISIPGESRESSVQVIRPAGLDVAVDIDGNLANRFQSTRSTNGLKNGGQIRSRVEGEGKFQVYEDQLIDLKAKLFEIATDPAKAKEILGVNWTIKVEDRYMKRNRKGELILAKDGFPIPDPMVDTYYDNANFDGAKKDMAIRYRWTEGNRTGAWNFKPGIGRSSPTGVMYRLEYGVDTTTNRPSAIARFADSFHALNPFKKIREQTGEKPSTFFKPAVKIIDHRYKFKLEHTNGLIVEISLDDAIAENLREGGLKRTRFGQLEMDIDHLATVSTVKMAPQTNNVTTGGAYEYYRSQYGAETVIAGGIALHDETDLQNKGAIISQHAGEFNLATRAIVKLRKALLGDNWMPGAQKYAIAAEKLQLIDALDASKSVKALHEKERSSSKVMLLRFLENDLTDVEFNRLSPDVAGGMCKAIFAR